MSLHKLAKKVQSTGRGQDSMLVHMSPREVRGLQQLARIKGGALTTNPETGLPEAGFLEDILPVVAAGAAMYFTAGAATPLLMSAGMGPTSAAILAGAGSGALIGGGSAAIQGGDVGQGALIGGTTGAITSGIGSAMGGASVDPNVALQQSTQVGTQAIGVNPATGSVIDPLAGVNAAGNNISMVNPSGQIISSETGQALANPLYPNATQAGVNAANMAPGPAQNAALDQLLTQNQTLTNGVGTPPNPADVGKTANQLAGDRLQQQDAARVAAAQKDPNASWWSKQSAMEKAGYSTLGAGLVAGLNAPPNTVDDTEEDYTSSLQRISPNFRAQEPIQPNPYYRARYPTYAAQGGLMDAYQAGGPVERMSQMNTALNPQGGMYPQGMIDKTQYALPTQRPTSMEVIDAGAQRTFNSGGQAGAKKKERADLTPESNIAMYDPYTAAIATVNNARNRAYLTKAQMPPAAMRTLGGIPTAAGGGLADLGSYSDGGRMLKGRGDGMSDSIPGIIGGKQPARLADGEFVVPADVVSHLGNGSTDAGAKRLYAMMDKVRKARTGKKKQSPAVNASRFLPA